MNHLDITTYRMYYADWVVRLATEAGVLIDDQNQTGADFFLFGSETKLQIRVNFAPDAPYLTFLCSDAHAQAQIDALAKVAIQKLANNDLGDLVWYSIAASDTLVSPLIASFIERLGSQRRILGWRRLGQDILIEFRENIAEDGSIRGGEIFAPHATCHIHIGVPGPRVGLASSRIANSALEVITAICAFAIGRPVSFPPVIFHAPLDTVPALNARRSDQSILTLARNSTSLDIFTGSSLPGRLDTFFKIRAALLTFNAARQSNHDSVACVLYVITAECLTTVETNWRRAKLTKRFVEFYDELMPDNLDNLVDHNNFEEVFDLKKGKRTSRSLRRAMLNIIYDFRSGNVHSGLRPVTPMFSATGNGDSMRRSLFAKFAEDAILQFIEAPRSSIVGHPNYEHDNAPAESRFLTGTFFPPSVVYPVRW